MNRATGSQMIKEEAILPLEKQISKLKGAVDNVELNLKKRVVNLEDRVSKLESKLKQFGEIQPANLS
jgi:hypothetical protein